jgi:hypothetical protein
MHLAGAAHDVVGPTELLARTARSDARFRTTALRVSALFRASKFLIFDAPLLPDRRRKQFDLHAPYLAFSFHGQNDKKLVSYLDAPFDCSSARWNVLGMQINLRLKKR